MTTTRRVLHGVVWAALSSWVRAGVSFASFGVVTRHLSPAEIGGMGVVTMLISLVETVGCAPLGDGLQQRRTLERSLIDATFWIILLLASNAAMILAVSAPALAQVFSAPVVAVALPWAAAGLLSAAPVTVANALMARALRFGEMTRIGLLSGLFSSAVTLTLVSTGFGLWSLVIADLAGRVVSGAWLWRAARYRLGPPRQLSAVAAMLTFNLGGIATYWLGYADRTAPRLLTGLLLGAAPLGYLMVAQRVLDLISQLILGPLNSVTMAAVANLQDDRPALQRLIRSLYQMGALFGYPVFLGSVVLVPDLARLAGPEWQDAVLATQILLLVGLRTSTGMFGIPILRGLGHSRWPLVLLGSGLALNLLLVPLGSVYGAAGVASAMLLRMLANWPLACWMIRRASGIPIREQAATGLGAGLAALVMALLTAAMLTRLPTWAPAPRIAAGVAFGAAVYLSLITLSAAPEIRRIVGAALAQLVRGDRAGALERLREGLRRR